MMLRLLVMLMAKSGVITFTPLSLFANGEQGAWYDPSDLTTMFQDAAGTTPVTAAEQPVGLLLDKSKGLVLGPELVVNGTFDTDLTGWSVGASYSWVSGRMFRVGGASDSALQSITTKIGSTYELIVDYEVLSNSLRILWGGTIVSQPNGTGKYRALLVATGTSTQITFAATVLGSSYYIDNISVRELPGNHATQTTATKRPILKLIAGKYSLLFDGIDDELVTGSINFTATDKMTVVAGVRKLSGNNGMIAELSGNANSTNGTFRLTPGDNLSGGGPFYSFLSRGTSGSADPQTAAMFYAPITNVLTGIASISTDVAVLRINGTQAATSAADQGTGNYDNYPLYIGSRAGTYLPFNGHLYSLIVRGAQSTDAQITSAEAWVNGKTGAY